MTTLGRMEPQREPKRSWIEETFCKRDCVKFIPTSQNPHRCYPLCQICQSLIRCCCGRLIGEHRGLDVRLPRSSPDGPSLSPLEWPATGGVEGWSVKQHTQASPTDAFGTIDFQDSARSCRAKYLRLSCDTKPDQVLQLMLKEWKMDMPKLVISVHGGTENFDLPLKVRHTFGKGLIKAAETTGAWILTEGMNTGVSRYLGDAAKLYGTREFRRRYTIGIAPWGIIQNHDDLIGKDLVRSYQTLGTPVYKRMSLNSQHSHFLLVDDGTVGMYGGQLELRRRLERHIRLQKIHPRLRKGVPVLCVVMAGGPDIISVVLDYVKSVPLVPTVVYEGTGPAADLLAFMHKQTSAGRQLDPDIKEDILLRIQTTLSLGKAQSNHIFKLLMECMDFRDSITIVDLDSEDQQDLDTSVLTALLKGTKASAPDQLSITLAWDRVDIAKKYILVYGQHWKEGSLEQAMLDALVMDRVSFVKLLIENGMNMNRFLTVSRLEQLYNTQEPTNSVLYHLVENVKQSHLPAEYWISLIDVGLVIEYLLGGAYSSTYTRKHFRAVYRNISANHKESGKDNMGRFNRLSAGPGAQLEKEDRGSSSSHFFRTAEPYKHKESDILPLGSRVGKNVEMNELPLFTYSFSDLFVWAVLKRRQKMALFLWQHGEEVMARAVVACKLYRSMAYEAMLANMGDSTAEELKSYSLEFGQLAVDLLDDAFRQDETMAMKLLTYEMKDWSNFTCLQMAVSSGLHPFVSHSCTQMLLTDLWMGRLNMRKNSWFKIILSILLPPAILMLQFKSQAEMSHVPQTPESLQFDRESGAHGDVDNGHTNMSLKSHYDMEKGPEHITSQDMPWTRKVYEFYSAPVVKFWFHTMAYLAFLMLYTYTVLVKMGPEPSIQEWLVIFYIFTTALEKVREVLVSEPRKLSKKLEVWFSEYWNALDFVAILLFFGGFVLRCHDPALRIVGRIFYCLDIIFWYLRLLDLFTVHQHVGPYLTMLTKMTTNMFNVVIMMAIVLVTFGVSRKAILSPDEPPSWTLARDVVFQPYWMIFGEVYAGEIDACADNQPCAPGSFITPFLQAVYLFVQYIIMVNTLIAFFNNVYMSMKSISDKIWKCNRYRYIMTYQGKPWLPPPFIVFSHLTLSIASICKPQPRKYEKDRQCGLKLYLSCEDLKKLHDFEEECITGYFHKKNQHLHCSVASRIRTTKERVEEVSGELQDVAEKVHLIKETLQSLDSQLGQLQDLSALTVDTLAVLSAKDTGQVEEALIAKRRSVEGACGQLPHSWSHVGHVAAGVESFRHKLHKQYCSTPSSLLRCLVRSPKPSLDEQDWGSVFSLPESEADSVMSGPLSITCSQSPLTSPQYAFPLGSRERTPCWSCDSSQSFHPVFAAESPEALHNKHKMHNSYFHLSREVSVEEEKEGEENRGDTGLRTSLEDSNESEGADESSGRLRSTSKWMHSSIPVLNCHSKRNSWARRCSCSLWAKRANTTLSLSQQRGLSRSSEIYLVKRRGSKMKARNMKTVKILERKAAPESSVRRRLGGETAVHKNWSASASPAQLNFESVDMLQKCGFSCQGSWCSSPLNSWTKSINSTSLVHNGARSEVKSPTFQTVEDFNPHYSAVERNNLMRLAYTIPFPPICALAGEEVSVYSLDESAADSQGCTVSAWSERGFAAMLQPVSREGMDKGLHRAMRVVCTWAEGHLLKPSNSYIVKAFGPEVVETWQKVFRSNTPLQLCLREIQQQRAAQKLVDLFNKIKPHNIPYAPRFLDVSLLYWHSEDKWFTIEKYITGDFRKYNSKTGEEITPNSCLEETILSFSHWTYHFSRGELLVLDLQGVGVELTGPSVITSDDESASGDMVFGPSNLGDDAIQRFIRNHVCNSCCRKLHLSDLRRSNIIEGEVNLAYEEESDIFTTRL